MPPLSLLFRLVVFQVLCGSLSSLCPQDCTCSSTGSIFCVQQNMIHMPRGLPSSTKNLYVFQNNIQTLNQQDFLELGELGMLDLSQNTLSEIPDGAFSPLSSLLNLDLSSNRITHLSKNSFTGLVKLERLYLYSNLIQSIHPDAFGSLDSLLELKLQGNQISVLPPLQMPRLLHLDLSFNRIPPPGPKHLLTPNIESLKIAGLGLKQLDSELLMSLKNLHVLDISQNQLVGIQPTLKAMEGLRSLNLSGNPLASRNLEDFQNMNNLLELDLSNINFQSFPEDFFLKFPRLEKLAIAENPFYCMCPLAWFPPWLKDSHIELLRMEETRCHFPLPNSGKVLAKLEHKDFGCPTTTIDLTSLETRSATNKPTVPIPTSTQAIRPSQPSEVEDTHNLPFSHTTAHSSKLLEDSDEAHMCPSNICLNGGTCRFDTNGQVTCLCPASMTGLYCEIPNELRRSLPTTSFKAIATIQPNTISSYHITSTSISLDLHHYFGTRPHIRAIRLTYRNLSGSDRRPLHLNVPATYPMYTLRGLQPNSTYSVCASPLGEQDRATISACMEAHTEGIPLSFHEPSVDKNEPSSLIPIVVAVVVVTVAAIIVTAVVVHRRRKSKVPVDMDIHSASPLEMDGVKISSDNGLTHSKQPDITPCPSSVQNGVDSETLLMQGEHQANNNLACIKPLYV